MNLNNRPHAKPPALLLVAGLVFLSLAGCRLTKPDPVVRLDAPTLELNGFTAATAWVDTPTPWTLEVEVHDASAVRNVTVLPNRGSGPTPVTVRVDPTGLPRLPLSFRLVLTAKHGRDEIVRTSGDFTFSYPDVTGRVTRAAAPSGARADAGPTVTGARPLSMAASLPEAGEDLTALPTTTLMVGLARSPRLPGAAGGALEPLGEAKLALSATLAGLDMAAVAQPFDLADLTLLTVPSGRAEQVAAALRQTPGVRYVDFPRRLYPASNDPLRPEQWNLDLLGVEPLWPTASGAGVTIAVLDQGFLATHPDLSPNVVGTYDAVTRSLSLPAPVFKCGSHGTHVAGIAAAVANNGEGIAGVAPDAKLLLVNLGDPRGLNCSMSSSALVEALAYVTNSGAPRASVVNMSLGASGDLGNAVRDAIAAAANAGISLVGAAGNDVSACPGYTTNPVYYPAAYPQVLAVAATGPDMARACYSHLGPEMFVAAPGGTQAVGEGVLSTVVKFPSNVPLPDYGDMRGTSMASPAVAGVIAMLRSAAPGKSAAEVADAIAATALDMGLPGHDDEYGWGFIAPADALEALTGEVPPPPEPVTDLTLRAPGYPDTALDADGLFTLLDAAPGPLTISAFTDDNGNGVLGEPGEWYGETTVSVAFGEFGPLAIDAVIVVEQAP